MNTAGVTVSMERLTIDEIIEHCERTIQRFESFSSREKCEKWNVDTQYGKEYWEHRQVKEYLEELKRYRDLEEQGLLLRLPVKSGDTVYAIGFNNKPIIYESVVLNILITEKEIVFNVKVDEFEVNSQLKQSMFGKTVFLTKAEAEQKLKEMESK